MGESSVARGAVTALVATTAARATGLLREIAFASAFGATVASDAYYAAFRVPNLFRDLFAEGALSSAFVPIFADVSARDGAERAFAMANALLGVLLLGAGGLALSMVAVPEAWVWLVAAGFWEVPEKGALTASLVQLLSPFLATVSVASVLAGMLQVRGYFFLPALAPAAFNICVMVGALIPAPAWSAIGLDHIAAVSLASVVGGALQALIQLPALRRLGWRPRLAFRDPALRRVISYIGPAFLGIATVQFGIVIDLQIASTMADGAVTYLRYGLQLCMLPMSLFAGPIAVSAIAAVSNERSRGQTDVARRSTTEALGLVVFAMAPACIGLMVLAEPITSLVFERGLFAAEDAILTGAVVQCYALGLIAYGLHRVLVPTLFAWGDPWSPAVFSVLAILFKIPLALGLSSLLGLPGLALAHVVSLWVEVLALAVWLRRRAGGLGRDLPRDLLWMLPPLGVLLATVWVLRPLGAHGAGTLLVVLGGAAAYTATAAATGSRQLGRIRAVLRPPRGLPPHLDEETVAALQRHADQTMLGLEIGTDAVRARTTAGALTLRCEADGLRARHTALEGAPPSAETDVLCITGILDLRTRPPGLGGLHLAWGSQEVTLAARDGQLVEGPCPGPRHRVIGRATRDPSR